MTFELFEKMALMVSLMAVIALIVFFAIRKCEAIAERSAQDDKSEEEPD